MFVIIVPFIGIAVVVAAVYYFVVVPARKRRKQLAYLEWRQSFDDTRDPRS